jgi:hypothetical protein
MTIIQLSDMPRAGITGSAWDCDWAGVMPGRYPFENDPIRKRGPLKYESGWMVYLAAAHAARIVPPQDVAVDILPGGAMLLAATADERFNARNPDHWAAARRIQAALTPLNESEDDCLTDD